MVRRSVVAALAVSFLLVATPASAGATYTLDVANFAFSPTAKTVRVQTSLSFAWDNAGPSTHTATSDAGFFDTGNIESGTTSSPVGIYGAGAYPYHCILHTSMLAVIRVRPTASETAIDVGGSTVITYGDSTSKGFTWDVQRRRDAGDWVTLRTGTGLTSLTFKPARTGVFAFRARTHDGTAVSGWSPLRRVDVSS
jgi:plastocyanin